ncbi:MAG: CYTH domain-containing protein [Tenuifilum sp.]|uniref:CYTH domain-containing protein n=1 Tax=Tenuifilum sp. TaxID=2760880 RepID=UPI002D00CDBD|nr:CYTH domain-containing protein [Tenuifilum sp.]HOK86143.1 CYTH domain-containing protein [Tenuifilum sp.]HON71162.1 CYTH domain-containing protein [Tenuifilum sp.]HOU74846.1 CYTH domain-containing protein [Tenuifilum sp.]HPP91011.1 CYTH domain-containing protein [Tenuifilum sp.]
MEIERKFLVDLPKWEKLDKPNPIRIVQGYLSTNPEQTIRVRVWADKAFMTIKGKVQGISREEIEFEIPTGKANELLTKFCKAVIKKNRYLIVHNSKTWEVDVFEGENAGLVLAEIELGSEDEKFTVPHWITIEVTDDYRYYNSYLSENPYSSWKK